MQVSLRSHLITGAVAVVGTSAVALAPVMQSGVELPAIPSESVSYALLANPVANPITSILTGLELVNSDLFNGFNTYPVLGGMYQGIIPEFINNALPIASQFGYNVSYYIGQAVSNVLTSSTSTVAALSNYIWDAAPAVVTAIGQVLSGDLDQALNTLYTAFIASIPGIISPTVDAVTTIVSGVTQNALNVIFSLAGIASSFVNTTVEVFKALTAEALSVTNEVVSQLASFNLIGAWNTYWEKGWGSAGFPGMLEALTLGAGLNPDQWPSGADYVPSFRVWAQTTNFTLADALGAAFPLAAAVEPGASVAPRSAAARVAAADEAAADAEAAADDSSGIGGASDVDTDDSDGLSAAADESDASSSAGDSTEGSAGGRSTKSGPRAHSRSGNESAHSGGGTGHGKAHGAARRAG